MVRYIIIHILMKQLESTATMLMKIRSGDQEAKNRLCAIYLPILTRWAHGRLPEYARDLSATDDMVNNTLLSALKKLNSFIPHREGAFFAYLRQILLNNIRTEIRKYSQKPTCKTIDQGDSSSASALEKLIGNEAIERYEKGLMKLSTQAREAVMLRTEFGYSYPEIATAIGSNSANSARMLVSRSLLNLAKYMNH